MKSVRFVKTLITTILLGFVPQFAWAGAVITYHGRILDSADRPVESSTVTFRIRIYSPNPGKCLLYEESRTVSMAGSNGIFVIPIGDGVGSRNASTDPGIALEEIFSNNPNVTFNRTSYPKFTCNTAGHSYTPTSLDQRQLLVSFDDNSGVGEQELPITDIGFVPLAVNAYDAQNIGGTPSNAVLRVSSGSASPLSGAQFTELVNLITGTSTTYTKSNQLGGATLPSLTGGQSLVWNGAGWSAQAPLLSESDPSVKAFAKADLPTTCGTDKFLRPNAGGTGFDCIAPSGGGSGTITEVTAGTGLSGGGTTGAVTLNLANVGTAGSYYKVTTDAQGRVTSGQSSLADSDIPSLPAGKITSGTFSDSFLAGLSIDKLLNGAGKYFNYKPANTACANGELLKYDTTLNAGAGGWKCAIESGVGSESDPTVQAFAKNSPSTGLSVNGSNQLLVDVGTTANKIVQLDGTGKLPAVDGSNLTNVTASGLSSTASINTSGNITTSGNLSVGQITASGNVQTTGDITTRRLFFYDHSGVGPDSIGLQAPSDIAGAGGASYVLTLPEKKGATGQVLAAKDNSGTLEWISPSAGSVTNVTVDAPLASSGGATPNLSLPKAATGQDGYLAKEDWNTFNAKQNAGNYVTTMTGDVTSSGFTAGSVTTTISNNAVTANKIADGAVGSLSKVVASPGSAGTNRLLATDPTTGTTIKDFYCTTVGHVLKWTGATGFGCNALTSTDIANFNTDVDARITAQKGQANGLATLDASSKVPDAQIPNIDWSKVSSKPSTLSGYGITDSLVSNGGGVGKITAGADGSKPALPASGDLFVATDTQKIYRYNGSAWDLISSASGSGGTITGITAGTGLSGGGTSGSVSIGLGNTTVTAGSYGSATQVGTFTVDAQGRLTAASNVTISGIAPGGAAGGDLSDTYPNPKVAKLQGRAVDATLPLDGQVLLWDNGNTTWKANYVRMQDVRNAWGGTQMIPSAACGVNQTMVWSVITDRFSCQAIGSLDASAITAGTLDAGRIPNLDIAKIATGTLSIARGGTNSGTALNNNRIMISSGGAIVEHAAITASRALASDANGLPVASAVTNTELGYLSGVTSSVQTQLTGKVSKSGDTMTGTLNLPGNGLVVGTKQLIATGGRIGIGVESPTQALQVGDGTATTTGEIRGYGAGWDAGFRVWNANTSAGANSYIDFGWGATSAVASIQSRTQSDNSTDLAFQASNTSKVRTDMLYIDGSTSNVGIGVADPKAKLDVYGTGVGTTVATTGATDPTTNVRIGRGAVGVNIGTIDNGTSYIQNRVLNDNTTNYNLSLQPNGGNVGIGVVNPTVKLEVNGPVKAQAYKLVWVTKTSANNGEALTSNQNVFVDVSSAAFGLILPATPEHGDTIKFVHAAGSLSTNNLTITAGAGDTILGDATLIMDINYGSIEIIFFDPNGDGNGDWRIM